MVRQGPGSGGVPAVPVRGPAFWIPAAALPLLLLGAAAAVFVLGSGPATIFFGCALSLGAVSALAFYASIVRRRRKGNRAR